MEDTSQHESLEGWDLCFVGCFIHLQVRFPSVQATCSMVSAPPSFSIQALEEQQKTPTGSVKSTTGSCQHGAIHGLPEADCQCTPWTRRAEGAVVCTLTPEPNLWVPRFIVLTCPRPEANCTFTSKQEPHFHTLQCTAALVKRAPQPGVVPGDPVKGSSLNCSCACWGFFCPFPEPDIQMEQLGLDSKGCTATPFLPKLVSSQFLLFSHFKCS